LSDPRHDPPPTRNWPILQHGFSATAELLVLNAVASNKKYVTWDEKHSRKGERCPDRPYINSGAGSGVVLRHRAAAAACACLTVDAAAALLHVGERSPD